MLSGAILFDVSYGDDIVVVFTEDMTLSPIVGERHAPDVCLASDEAFVDVER